MNEFFEVLAIILFVAAALALWFLFGGDPSLWTKLHAAAMEICK